MNARIDDKKVGALMITAGGLGAWRLGLISLAIGGPVALVGLGWLIYEIAKPDPVKG